MSLFLKYKVVLFEGVSRLRKMGKGGLVQIGESALQITQAGTAFIRNICIFFDAHYRRKIPVRKIFSS